MTVGSTVAQKITASVVNCSLILGVGIPFYKLMPPLSWKLLLLTLFWSYSLAFSGTGHDVGMWIAGTKCEPWGPLGATAYSASFATLLFRVRFPFDLCIANGCCQVSCLYEFHNTMHGLVAGYHTVRVT